MRILWAVGSGVLAVCWIGCAGAPVETPADLILRGGVILRASAEDAADSLAISGDRIVAVGTSDETLRWRGPDTRVVDLGEATVIPGFVDHHVHLLNLGMSLLNTQLDQELFLDLGDAGSLTELASRVRQRAEARTPGTWIVGKGWSQGAWGETRLPDHRILSEAAPRHPVYLSRVDGHAGWANLAALALAGIDSKTPDPPGGAILRGADGKPTGVLLERANELILPLLPQPSDRDVRRAFRLAAEKLAQQGVVEAFDAGFLAFPGVVGLNLDMTRILQLLRDEDAENPLPLRVHLMIPAPSALAEEVLAQPEDYRQLSPRLAVTHLKLFADGAMGSRGAAMAEPFSDDPATVGVPRMSADEIGLWTRRALDANLDVAVHAIGDAAVARTLDAFEEILKERPELPPRRLRIEHFSLASAPDFTRAARLGVGLSIQPDFVAPDDSGATMEDSRVGPTRAERVYAFRRLAEAGAALAAGSDYFDQPGPPLLTFYAAATRANASGKPSGGWHPDQRFSRREALELATTPLPPGGGERPRGLAAGGRADLTILSVDPLTVPDRELLSAEVLAVISGGRVTYQNGSLPGLAGSR